MLQRTIFALGLCCLTAALRAQTATAPDLLPIPDLTLQASSQETLHQLFAADFAKTAPADRLAFARQLLTQARAIATDDPARYVALLDAISLSAGTGDAPTALTAIDELARHYRIDRLDLRRTALLRAGETATREADFQALVPLALDTADLAADADAFDAVVQLASLAETAANKSHQLPLIASIQIHLADLRALAISYVEVNAARARLATAPSDASAHLTLGRFYALAKGQWSRGLSDLAQSGDPDLAALAARELEKPSDGIAQAALADAWWAYAEKCPDPARARITAHAIDLYKTALQSLQTSTLPRIQARIQQGTATAPAITVNAPTPAAATAQTLNLLALIDPARDAAQGNWSRTADGIACASGPYACLQLPCLPPDEYDLTAAFTRTQDDGSIALLIAAQKRAFEFVADIKGEARFERVNAKVAQDNPTVTPVAISNARRYTLTVEVRSDHVRALLDGKELVSYKTDLKDLTRYANWKLGDNTLCGLGANGATVTFHAVTLTEVKGKAKPTR